MTSRFSTEAVARRSARHPWITIGIWLAVMVLAVVSASSIGDRLTTEQKIYEDVESMRALDLREDAFSDERLDAGLNPDGEQEVVVLQSPTLTVDDPGFRAIAEEITTEIRALGPEAVAQVVTFYETDDPSLVSDDRRTMMLPVVLGTAEYDTTAESIIEILHEHDGENGFVAVTGGQGSLDVTFNETSEKDLREGEMQIGLPVALIILVIVFGALAAAGLPMAVALVSIVIALGITALLGRAFELSVFVVNVITTIGLAVGIDYSLLVVQRFREERRKGRTVEDAIARSGATANKAVLFSGMAVIAALAGLIIVPDSIFRSLGTGAIIVTVVAIFAATTLLPAILRLMGDKVNAIHIGLPRRGMSDGEAGKFWTRTSAFVMKHAVLSLVVSVGILVAAIIPYFTIETGQSGVSSLPESSDPYRAFTILNEEFNAGVIEPADIVVAADDVTAPEVQGGIDELLATLAGDEMFGEPTVTTNGPETVTLISVPVEGDAQSDEARATVLRLRDQYIPAAFNGVDAEILVGGNTAGVMDYSDVISRYTPIVFTFVLGLSFIILLVVFRSIVVPLKAIVMNLLSVGAAYGLMVLVFQHGVGADLLGFGQVERIDAWIPLFLFAILFGLSMDYHVFLLSRIRERYDETHNNRESVAFGVRTTAGMITGAAAIMVAVFSGFAMGELVMFQQMGFGLAIAVLLDATLIRTVVVPASMALLGDANWYLPSWLHWLPRLDIEGRGHAEPAPAAAEA